MTLFHLLYQKFSCTNAEKKKLRRMYHIHSSNRFSFSFWSGHSVPSTLLGSEWMIMFSSVQLLSCVQFFETPWTTARQASLSITNSRTSPKHMSIESVMPSHPLSSPSPPSLNLPQHQGLFRWVSSSHQVAKILEFQLHYQSFQWIFRTDFL